MASMPSQNEKLRALPPPRTGRRHAPCRSFVLLYPLFDVLDVGPAALIDFTPVAVEVECRERFHARVDDGIAAIVLVHLQIRQFHAFATQKSKTPLVTVKGK